MHGGTLIDLYEEFLPHGTVVKSIPLKPPSFKVAPLKRPFAAAAT
jgi:hypothetical protein